MRLNLTIVLNGVPTERVEGDIERFCDYLESRTPYNVSVTQRRTFFKELPLKSFGVFDLVGGREELYGLDGVKEMLRPIVPRFVNHAVIFIYDLGSTKKVVAPWTTFGELHPGTEFTEIPYSNAFDKKYLFRSLSHEVFHILHNRAHRAGIWTADTMDRYDEEFDPYSENGNRARNLAELAPHFEAIAEQPTLKLYLRQLIRRFNSQPDNMPQPLLSPVTAIVSQPFGVPSSDYKSGIHNGTDYMTKVGTEVLAPAFGAITQVWENNKTMGNACLYEFSFEGQLYTLRLLHLRKAPIKGVYDRGEIICYTGATGKVTGPHLHLEVWKGKYRPEVLLSEASVRANLVDPVLLF